MAAMAMYMQPERDVLARNRRKQHTQSVQPQELPQVERVEERAVLGLHLGAKGIVPWLCFRRLRRHHEKT